MSFFFFRQLFNIDAFVYELITLEHFSLEALLRQNSFFFFGETLHRGLTKYGF